MNQQTNELYQEQQQRDLPQTLPSYPDVDGSAPPVYPQPIPPIVTQPGQPVMRCCRVRFFHAAVQAGSLNVNVGSQRVASNLAFGNFSTYYCFAEGFRTVSLINAGSGRTLLLRKTVPMSYGEQLTFVIVNNASTGALELVRVNDTACSGQMGGFGCLRMANFLLGDTALDLLTADGRVLFSDVRYKETTRLRPGSYSFLVANTPVRIEPRIQDVEMDQGEWRISQRYLPGYGEMDLLLSFGMQARRGVLSTAYIIGQANTGEVQVVVSENR